VAAHHVVFQEARETMLIDQRPSPARAAPGPVLLTFKEAMEFLRVSRSTIYRLMWSGQLRGHKVGSSWRFYEANLLDAVASADMDAAGDRGSQDVEG
jgi:excisionase family DNA binding protein